MSAIPAEVNYWPESSCARAFWGQHEAPAYQRLLADTAAWLDPRPGESWLDLGCGCGKLSQTLWVNSGGRVARIVGSDCAAVNEEAFARLRAELQPAPRADQFSFVPLDFSEGLHPWSDGEFDGVVSGLALQYAQSYSVERGGWTTDAYDRLLAEIYRVLKPGGRLVFSVNVPEPSWAKVALLSLSGVLRAPRPGRHLKNAFRMLRYGRWLKQEARRGRFHYLPADVLGAKLRAVGFTGVEDQLTYAGQAFLFRCRKGDAALRQAG